MSTFFAFHASPLHLSPFPHRTPIRAPILHPTHFPGLPNRRSLGVARFGFRHFHSDGADAVIGDLFGRVETLLYTIADAAVSASDAKQSGDWLSGITNYMESVLKVLKGGLSTLHVPYAYGFAIILLTVLVKAATFPLTKKQVESAMAMRSLQPQIKAIQERYAGDQERIQLETARLYKLAGINPLAGCLPTLATIPVWIGLYRALSNVADEGLLTEGFFWIPSLSGPTTIAARQNGSGISWLFPFVDGHPPLGWSDTLAYLVLPLLLIVSQYISVQIMQSSQSNDPSLKTSQALTKFLPLMIGYFALSVPSGLSLYWFTNNILSTAQQVWLQKLGGAQIPAREVSDDIEKEELSQIQKSVFEINSTKKEPKQAEILMSEGLRPGERFKQIKEQEARRRQQREEEKKKAEEAAANRIPTTNGGYKNEANSTKSEYRTGGDLVDGGNDSFQSMTTTHNSSNIEVVLNGELSSEDSKDGQNMHVTRAESSGNSVNYGIDGRDEQHINGKLEKEIIEVCTDNKPSGEETFQRREQPTEREEV